MLIAFSKIEDNRVRSSVLLMVNWIGKMNISLSSFAPVKLISRDRFVSGTRHHNWYQCSSLSYGCINNNYEVSLQPMIPPKRFDISPPDWGILRRAKRVQIFP